MSGKPVRHPSTTKLFQQAARRFMALRQQHRRACDLMWAGTLASEFSNDELSLLNQYLSPHDYALLKGIAR